MVADTAGESRVAIDAALDLDVRARLILHRRPVTGLAIGVLSDGSFSFRASGSQPITLAMISAIW